MKFTVPAFFLGTALGIAGTWFALQPPAGNAKTTPANSAATASASADQVEITRLRSLVAAQTAERQALEVQLGKAEKGLTEKKTEDAKDEGFGGMMAKMMEGDKITKMMETQAKTERRAKVERLSSRLKLTPEQRASLEAFLEKQDKAKIAQMEKFQKSPLMKRMFSGQELTEEEQKEIAQMEKSDKPSSTKDWAKENLTPEQTTNYERYQQERKAAQAETSATQQLNQVSSVVDLSEEQKDKIFKHYSEKAMKAPLFEDMEGAAGAVMIAGASDGEASSATVSSEVHIADAAEGEDTGDNELKNILTPDQLATYQAHQEEQKKAQEEMMKALGLPNLGKPKGDKKKK